MAYTFFSKLRQPLICVKGWLKHMKSSGNLTDDNIFPQDLGCALLTSGCLNECPCFYLFNNSNPASGARPANKFVDGLYVYRATLRTHTLIPIRIHCELAQATQAEGIRVEACSGLIDLSWRIFPQNFFYCPKFRRMRWLYPVSAIINDIKASTPA